MTAEQARQGVQRAEAREAAARRAEAKREAERQAKADAAAIKNIGKFRAEVYKAIEEASNRKERRTRIDYRNWAAAEIMKKKLVGDGYTVHFDHYAGYENYGDFNAPCNVWTERSWMDVSW